MYMYIHVHIQCMYMYIPLYTVKAILFYVPLYDCGCFSGLCVRVHVGCWTEVCNTLCLKLNSLKFVFIPPKSACTCRLLPCSVRYCLSIKQAFQGCWYCHCKRKALLGCLEFQKKGCVLLLCVGHCDTRLGRPSLGNHKGIVCMSS